MAVTPKTPEELAGMRTAGRLAAEVLEMIEPQIEVGMFTGEIDRICHDYIVNVQKAIPAPLNSHGFPKSICTSVNEVICHGIPDSRIIRDGDIMNLDVTGFIGGVHGDTNATFCIGDVDPASRELVRITEECTWRGIEAVRPGRPLSDIGRAIEDHARTGGYGVVRAFIGHGIGHQFHTDIQVLHYYDSRAATVMQPGMVFTIEPMINLGRKEVVQESDGWTIATADGLPSAHFEHDVVVREDEVEVLSTFKWIEEALGAVQAG